MRPALLLLAIPLCTACYSYAETELSSLPEGARVRARITTAQAQRVEPLIGRETRVLDGVLLGQMADTVLLEVPSAARTTTGGGIQVLHQRLSIPRADITELELKQLSRTRTTALIVIGSAALGYLMLDALNIGPGDEGPPTEPGGPELRIPLLRLPVR